MSGGLRLALAVACAGGAWFVWRLRCRQKRLGRTEPWLRLLSARDYHPSTPPWLATAAALASSSPSPPGGSAECTTAADAQLPPPVREEVARHRAAAAAGRTAGLLGAAARRELFLLEEGTTYLNHGSYGAALRLAVVAQRYFQDRLEAQPVRFMEEEALRAVRQAQLALAQLVGAQPQDLVFVSNATTAANAVLRSVPLAQGDLVLLATTTYPAVRSAAARVASERGAALLEVDLHDVLDQPQAVLHRFEAALVAGGGRVRLAILDHIISLAPVHLPVAVLCTLCHAHGAASLVDGAHAVGAVPLRLPDLGCDYYTSNLHKWACTPKGAAFLWAHPSRQQGLLPLVTSHGYELGFQGEFLWSGTSDWTAVMAVPTALAVLQALEPEASRYRQALLRRAVALLLGAWGTHAALGLQADEACMCAVELPSIGGAPPSARLAANVHDVLRRQHAIEVPIASAGGKMWCRISAQIYNELADYQRLADAVLQRAEGQPEAGGAGTGATLQAA